MLSRVAAVRALARGVRRLSARAAEPAAGARATSTAAAAADAEAPGGELFAKLFLRSPHAAELPRGALLRGHVVAPASPFARVDFGLKSEVPFVRGELLGREQIGDQVVLPLLQVEDEFNEPSMDYTGQYLLPRLVAERYRLLEPPTPPQQEAERRGGELRFVYGRVTSLKRGGFNVKVLGVEAFMPRTHCVALVHPDGGGEEGSSALDRHGEPLIGSFMPFVLLSMDFHVEKDGGRSGSSTVIKGSYVASGRSTQSALASRRVRILPVLSSYASHMYILTSLLQRADELGLEPEERVAYLRLLTRIVWQRSHRVRRHHAIHTVPRVRRMLQHRVESDIAGGDSGGGGYGPSAPLSDQRGTAVADAAAASRRRRASRFKEAAERAAQASRSHRPSAGASRANAGGGGDTDSDA